MNDGGAQFSKDSLDPSKFRKPNEEEVKVYNECINGAYYKVGLPFAVISLITANFFKKPGPNGVVPRSSLGKTTFIFIANSILGTFLYFPFCYSRFLRTYMENVQKEQEETAGDVPALQLTEGTLPQTNVEDFSYPVDAVTQLNESEGSFSSDFNYSRLLDDDSDRFSAKSQTTTYSDLRARHRNEQTNPRTPGLFLNAEKAPSTFSTPSSKREEEARDPHISSRPVRKNMYGDEME